MCVRVFSVGFGPGLDLMFSARSRCFASHAVGTHGWLPQKTGWPGLRRGGVGGYNLHSVPPNSPPDCGTSTTSRLYPFGAVQVVIDLPLLRVAVEGSHVVVIDLPLLRVASLKVVLCFIILL